MILILIIFLASTIGLVIFLRSGEDTDTRSDAAGEEQLYYVSPSGSANPSCTETTPCDSITTALNVAGMGQSPNQRIVVKDGTYAGIQKIIQKPFLHEVIISAENPYKAILENSGAVMQIFNARNVKITGFEMRHINTISSCSTQDNSGYIIQLKDNSDPDGPFGAKRGPDNGYYDSNGKFYPNGSDYTGNITIENNIIHDSYCEDLIKLQNGGDINIVGNMFYNQATRNNTNGSSNNGSTPEEAIDANSVFNVNISGNIFYNDYATASETGSFIVVKASNLGLEHGNKRKGLTDQNGQVVVTHPNGNELEDNSNNALPQSRTRTCDPSGSRCDTNVGSNNVKIDRNVFMNFISTTPDRYPFLQLGAEDSMFYVLNNGIIENNLFLGNGAGISRAIFETEGINNLTFRNNTIQGNLPSRYYGFRLKNQDESWNYPNNKIYVYNNIWSDPSGTMGSEGAGDSRYAISDSATVTENRQMAKNLFWNNSSPIPVLADYLSQYTEDTSAVLLDPGLTNPAGITTPKWQGSNFRSFNGGSGYSTYSELFIALVDTYAKPSSSTSPVIDSALPQYASQVDILNRSRGTTPDIGAYEFMAAAPPPPPPTVPGGFETLKVNFQPSSATTPSGYIVDSGAKYASRNGEKYGWQQKTTFGSWSNRANNSGRERSNDQSQLRDTLIHMQMNGTYRWQFDLPDGEYNVVILAGDPSYTDSWNSFKVEGEVVNDNSYDNFDYYSVDVEISDGSLTIEPVTSSKNAKINYLIISQ